MPLIVPIANDGDDKKLLYRLNVVVLGLTWKSKWSNDYETNAIAEEFVALLQILLTDLASYDLCLLKSTIMINIFCENEAKEPHFHRPPSNTNIEWRIILPSSEKIDHLSEPYGLHFKILGIACAIITEVSLLPMNELRSIFEECFKNGLSSKVFVAKPYNLLYKEIVPKDTFETSKKFEFQPLELHRKFKLEEHEKLKWRSGVGPTYNRGEAHGFLRNRYDRSLVPIKVTLKRLLGHTVFKTTVERLKSEGWFDWHILSSLSVVAVNYRLKEKIRDASFDGELYRKVFVEILNKPETEDMPPIPLDVFSEEKIKETQKTNMMSTLKILGLECHQETPNFDAVNDFLTKRYNYWQDDIGHDDPFMFQV